MTHSYLSRRTVYKNASRKVSEKIPRNYGEIKRNAVQIVNILIRQVFVVSSIWIFPSGCIIIHRFIVLFVFWNEHVLSKNKLNFAHINWTFFRQPKELAKYTFDCINMRVSGLKIKLCTCQRYIAYTAVGSMIIEWLRRNRQGYEMKSANRCTGTRQKEYSKCAIVKPDLVSSRSWYGRSHDCTCNSLLRSHTGLWKCKVSVCWLKYINNNTSRVRLVHLLQTCNAHSGYRCKL